MKRALLLLALFTQATFGAVPAPYPLTVDSQSASAPMLQLYRASPRTIRVQFTDGGTAADLTGLTTNDLHLTWATSNASPAFVASDVAIVNATNGQADFTFTSGDLNYAQGRYIYEAAAGSTVVKQGALIILGSPFSTGTNSPAWTTNINLSGYTFINYPWLTDAPSDGSIYGRQDGGWAAVTGGGGGSTTDTTARAWAVGASNLALSAYGAASNAAAAATNAHTLAATASNLAASAVAGLPSLVALSNGVVSVGLAATNAGNTAAQAQVLGSNAISQIGTASNALRVGITAAGAVASNALPLSGGTMSGGIDMGTNAVAMNEIGIKRQYDWDARLALGFYSGTNIMSVDWVSNAATGKTLKVIAWGESNYFGRGFMELSNDGRWETNLQAAAIAAGGVLPALDGSGLTNLPAGAAAGAQLTWTNNQNAGGHALTNVNGLVVTGGQVRFVSTDVRISTPTLGDQPATKDYVDSGATAYTTNAINRLVYPDSTTNAGITILGFTDPAITNVVVDGDGKATLQFRRIPDVVWSYAPTGAVTAWDDMFDAEPVTTNDPAATSAWYVSLGRGGAYWVTNGHLLLTTAQPSTGFGVSVMSKALPAPPWRFVMDMQNPAFSNLQCAGISLMTAHVGGRVMLFGTDRYNAGAGTMRANIRYYTTPTSEGNSSLHAQLDAPTRYHAIENDGTNMFFSASENGLSWLLVGSTPTSTMFGSSMHGTNSPNRIGIAWDWSSAAGAAVNTNAQQWRPSAGAFWREF